MRKQYQLKCKECGSDDIFLFLVTEGPVRIEEYSKEYWACSYPTKYPSMYQVKCKSCGSTSSDVEQWFVDDLDS